MRRHVDHAVGGHDTVATATPQPVAGREFAGLEIDVLNTLFGRENESAGSLAPVAAGVMTGLEHLRHIDLFYDAAIRGFEAHQRHFARLEHPQGFLGDEQVRRVRNVNGRHVALPYRFPGGGIDAAHGRRYHMISVPIKVVFALCLRKVEAAVSKYEGYHAGQEHVITAPRPTLLRLLRTRCAPAFFAILKIETDHRFVLRVHQEYRVIARHQEEVAGLMPEEGIRIYQRADIGALSPQRSARVWVENDDVFADSFVLLARFSRRLGPADGKDQPVLVQQYLRSS